MLTVRNASLSFGGIHALAGLSFTAEQGEITAIIGPNGAGKTSLFNIISGFYQPQEGEILIDGQDVTGLRPDRRSKLGVSRTFQQLALFRGMSVLDNIKLGGHNRLSSGFFSGGFYYGRAQREEAEFRKEIERDVIDFLELDHIRNAPVAALPYGLQKRVELARALAMKPKLILFDEPTSALDAAMELEVIERFRELTRESTAILVSHRLSTVKLADRIAIMKDGVIVQIGTPEDIVMNPADDYVREFVQGISKLKLVKAHSIMEPMASYQGPLDGAPRADEGADLDQLIDLAVGTDLPVVITQGTTDIGIVTKPRLLRGIQGGKDE